METGSFSGPRRTESHRPGYWLLCLVLIALVVTIQASRVGPPKRPSSLWPVTNECQDTHCT